MLPAAIGLGLLAKALYDTDQADKMDERALKKYSKAFEKNAEAQELIRKKAEFTDKRLMNVAKKKRAILQNTIPKFAEVYGQIQKLELEYSTTANELISEANIQKASALNSFSVSHKKELTDKELICGFLLGSLPGALLGGLPGSVVFGYGKAVKMDSERYLSAANSQMRSANVAYSQAESISEVYDAIVARADRISKLLMSMNALFTGSINETAKTIERNGLNVRNYSDYDKGVLMTCVNMASAVADIINIPVLDEEGEICEAAVEMIATGEEYVQKMNKAIQE